MSRELKAFCMTIMASRDSTLSESALSRKVWQRRANRTMEEGVVSMLYESGCLQHSGGRHWPLSFTAATDPSLQHSQTAHLMRVFHGTKDLSLLHVWGCTAYVLIQRDKHSLGSLGDGEVCIHCISSGLQELGVLQPCDQEGGRHL